MPQDAPADVPGRDMQDLFVYLEREVKGRLDELSHQVAELTAAISTEPQQVASKPASGGAARAHSTDSGAAKAAQAKGDIDPEPGSAKSTKRGVQWTGSAKTSERSSGGSAFGEEKPDDLVLSAGEPNASKIQFKGDHDVVIVEEQAAHRCSAQRAQLLKGFRDGAGSVDSTCRSQGLARVFDLFVAASVLSSIFFASERERTAGFAVFEGIVDVIFIAESLVRFIRCPNRKRFFVDAMNVVDMCSGLPILVLRLYIELQGPTCLSTNAYSCMTLYGIVPVLRLCRLVRRFQLMHLMLSAIQAFVEALPMLLYMYLCIMMAFTAVLYIAEPQSNVESFSGALWLALVSMATVGYGDIAPVSDAGKVATGVFTFATVLYPAIPFGIIGSAFSDAWKDRDRLALARLARAGLERTGHSLADLAALFEAFDADGNDTLGAREFQRMARTMKLGLTADRTMKLYAMIEGGRGDGIDVRAFTNALSRGVAGDLDDEQPRPSPWNLLGFFGGLKAASSRQGSDVAPAAGSAPPPRKTQKLPPGWGSGAAIDLADSDEEEEDLKPPAGRAGPPPRKTQRLPPGWGSPKGHASSSPPKKSPWTALGSILGWKSALSSQDSDDDEDLAPAAPPPRKTQRLPPGFGAAARSPVPTLALSARPSAESMASDQASQPGGGDDRPSSNGPVAEPVRATEGAYCTDFVD
eukprot:CAMPEP_0176074554 /NCGR_PEP_ID=MMETSP0120_2-20121206/37258_1 /TAXON_ID=160619 /ORGANISM="Kryptoperidinium foliaceum, Strain CCMP 1326" /LENGTH=694 /DNA_ID=CAMNT_0017408249 /DNA_START=112 /DNA_END=2194 /DNA_ORIENTATION=+